VGRPAGDRPESSGGGVVGARLVLWCLVCTQMGQKVFLTMCGIVGITDQQNCRESLGELIVPYADGDGRTWTKIQPDFTYLLNIDEPKALKYSPTLNFSGQKMVRAFRAHFHSS